MLQPVGRTDKIHFQEVFPAGWGVATVNLGALVGTRHGFWSADPWVAHLLLFMLVCRCLILEVPELGYWVPAEMVGKAGPAILDVHVSPCLYWEVLCFWVVIYFGWVVPRMRWLFDWCVWSMRRCAFVKKFAAAQTYMFWRVFRSRRSRRLCSCSSF
jgi:hypothetical protein